MSYKCITCDSCIAVNETLPYGVCVFFPSGHRNVHAIRDTCANHSKERDEEREQEASYYKSLRKRK